MKVILAGFSKTGTKTMCEVFSILGYNNYDALENGYYLHDEWVKVITKGGTPEDFRQMYKGVDSVTDMPCYFFWEQLHEAFPDAKIILTLRDEDSWYPSFVKQWNELNRSYVTWFINAFSPTLWKIRAFRYHTYKLVSDVARYPCNQKTPFGETLLRKMYREHNTYVMQKAPKDKLLVYKVSEGWEPLCKFLGEEIPDQPFPHKNKGASLVNQWTKQSEIMKRFIYEAVAVSGMVTALGVAAVYKLYAAGHLENGWNLISQHVSMVTNYFFPA